MALHAEYFAVGEPVAAADRLSSDVVVLRTRPSHALGTAACVSVISTLALATTAGPDEGPVLRLLRKPFFGSPPLYVPKALVAKVSVRRQSFRGRALPRPDTYGLWFMATQTGSCFRRSNPLPGCEPRMPDTKTGALSRWVAGTLRYDGSGSRG